MFKQKKHPCLISPAFHLTSFDTNMDISFNGNNYTPIAFLRTPLANLNDF